LVLSPAGSGTFTGNADSFNHQPPSFYASVSSLNNFLLSSTAASTYVAQVAGKQLSTEDYTTAEKTKLAGVAGTNTGDETTASIKSKLGITTLSGSNTGDQDLSGLATIASLNSYLLKSDSTIANRVTVNTSNIAANTTAILLKADKTGTSDIEITDATKGIILKSPNGTRYRITVNNDGSLTTTAL
jgi:hypothetical protein